MPEAPDLYVLREYLAPRIEGEVVDVASELRPLVVRNMAGVPLAEDISGRTIERLDRKGKLLMMSLSGGGFDGCESDVDRRNCRCRILVKGF